MYEETNEPSVSSSRMETSVHVVHTETPDKRLNIKLYVIYTTLHI